MFVNGTTSVMFLTVLAVSIERYVAICHPLLVSKYKLSSTSQAIKIIPAIWLLGYSTTLPGCLLMGSKLTTVNDSIKNICRSEKDSGRHIMNMILVASFFLPCWWFASCMCLLVSPSENQLELWATTTNAAIAQRNELQKSSVSYRLFIFFIL